MRKIELAPLMATLYDTMDYFVKIDPEGQPDFEEDYHFIAKDPDGKERKLLEERDYNLAASKEVVSYLANSKPGKMLDVGCGPGWILSTLDEKWDKYGVEISKFASDYASKFGKIYNGTLEDYKEKGFDTVLMYHVIEHVPDPISSIRKIHSLLKKGGTLILGTPDFDAGAARRFGKNHRFLNDPTHINLFSSDSMHRCLRDHGFKIKYVEYPFFDTHWFTGENLLRMLDTNAVSPPFYGSIMTFFCEKI